MPNIQLREYKLPNGRRIDREKAVDDETFAKAKLIVDSGFAFEFEWLRTGDASFTILDWELEEDVGGELILNPTEEKVNVGLKKMIMDFDVEKAVSYRENANSLEEDEDGEYDDEDNVND